MKKNNIFNYISLVLSIIAIILLVILNINTNKKINDLNNQIIEVENKRSKMYESIMGYPEYDVSMFKEIKAKDINELSQNNKIIVFLGRSSCGYCAMYAPVLKDIQNNKNVTIYYLNIAEVIDYQGVTTSGILDEEADNILHNLETTTDTATEVLNEYGATPLTLVIEDNKLIDGIVGYTEYENVEALLQNNNIIK